MSQERRTVTVFFPVYNDEHTVETVTNKALTVLPALADDYEVLIINDGSLDRSGQIADRLAEQHAGRVRVVHHETNLGYGRAVRTGLSEARFDWICFTDGDDQYDLFDLPKLFRLTDYYQLIITFRYRKIYSGWRQFVSATYNTVLRYLFKTSYRDISTGLRLISKSLQNELELESDSPFIGAEIAIKAMLKGYPVGEVGIQTYPRAFGVGQSTTLRNIISTIKDMLRIYRHVFSTDYERIQEPVNSRQKRDP